MVNPALLMLNLPFMTDDRNFAGLLRGDDVIIRADHNDRLLHTGFFCRARIRIQRETGADMVMTADEFCHIQIQRFSPPHRQIFLRLCDGLFSLAQISFDFFDTTPANVRAFFILRVKQCRPRPFFPVFRTFKSITARFMPFSIRCASRRARRSL